MYTSPNPRLCDQFAIPPFFKPGTLRGPRGAFTHEEVYHSVPSPWHIELQSWPKVTLDRKKEYRGIYLPHHLLGVSEVDRLFYIEAPSLLR